MKYKAFLSYSNGVDGRLAPALQNGLHRFAKPVFQLRAMRIFRDRTTFADTSGLWPGIKAALVDSEFFLLLASPEAAASPWVCREVEWWLEHRPTERILFVLTGGSIQWDHGTGDFDWTRTTALPRLLEKRFKDEPFYVDLSWARTEEELSARHSRFRQALLDLAAPLHGRPKDELDGEDVREFRRRRRLAWMATVGIVALLGLLALSTQARLREAERRNRIAVAERLVNDAERQTSLDTEILERRALLALEAVKRFDAVGQPSVRAQRVLADAVTRLPRKMLSLPGQSEIAAFDSSGPCIASVRENICTVTSLKTAKAVQELAAGSRIIAVEYQRTGGGLFVAEENGTCTVYDPATRPFKQRASTKTEGKLFKAGLLGQGGHIYSVTQLADKGQGLKVTIWKTDGLKKIFEREYPRMQSTEPSDAGGTTWEADARRVLVAIDGVGKSIAIFMPLGWAETGVSVYDLDSQACTYSSEQIAAEEAGTRYVQFCPPQTLMIVGNFELKKFNLATGSEMARWGLPSNGDGFAVNRDGSRIAVSQGGTEDIFVPLLKYASTTILDGDTGKPLTDLVTTRSSSHVIFAPKEDACITASNGTISFWNFSTGDELRRFSVPSDAKNVLISPDAAYLAAIDQADNLHVWSLADIQELIRVRQHGVQSVALSQGGELMALALADKTVRVVDVGSGAESTRIELDDDIKNLLFSPDKRYLVGTGERFHAWELPGGTERESGNFGAVKLRFSKDGKHLAAATGEGIKLWEVGPFRELWTQQAHRAATSDLAFDPSGQNLWSSTGTICEFTMMPAGTTTPELRSWRLSDGDPQKVIPLDSGVRRLFFDRDGRRLAVAREDAMLSVLPAGEKESTQVLAHPGNENWVHQAAFGDDYVVSVSASKSSTFLGGCILTDHAVRLWQLQPDAMIRFQLPLPEFGGSTDYVERVNQSSISAYLETVLLNWDATRLAAREYRSKLDFWAANRTDKGALVHRDLVVWQVDTGGFEEILRTAAGGSPLGFDPTGQFLLTKDDDFGTIHAWQFRDQDFSQEACFWLGRNLTGAEWKYFLREEPYRATCPKKSKP